MADPLNPYSPARESGIPKPTTPTAARVLLYAVSAFVFVAGVVVFILGLAAIGSVVSEATEAPPYGIHGPYTWEWTKVAMLLCTGGLLWMFAACAYGKRRTRIGHWFGVAGLVSLCLGMTVGFPI